MPQDAVQTSTPLLALREVTLRFDRPVPVLDSFNLTIGQGEFLLLEGPSGGGKSSLLRLMVRLETPDSGKISFRGASLDGIAPQVLRTKVRLMPQIPVMIQGTVRDNLLLPFRFRQNRNEAVPDQDALEDRLEHVQLDKSMLDHMARDLSVGQQQRVALLRTLMVRPEVLLLDEPTSGLDRESRRIVESSLFRLNKDEGMSVVLVSHHELQETDAAVRRVTVNNRDSGKGKR